MIAGVAHREERPPGWEDGGPTALCLHGFPECSYTFRELLPALADRGYRALAFDLPGMGDSPPDPPLSWERCKDKVESFRQAAGIERAALVVRDWGALIGLAWACEHPEAVSALVISSSGFFPDGKWHGLAQTLRSDEGEAVIANFTPELLAETMKNLAPGITDDAAAEFAKCVADDVRKQGVLDFYRSMDFDKLAPYEGKLAELAVPTLVLWGAKDEFAPVAGAHRLVREIPDAKLVVLEDAGHFLQEERPARVAEEIASFLGPLA